MRLNFAEFSNAFLSDDNYYAHMLNRRPSNHRHHLHRRDDCFFPDTQVEHRNMWRVHFKVELAAEAVRQRLDHHPHFNTVQAFNSLDLNADGRINSCEIKRIIESRGFFVTQKEAQQVLAKFDENKDGQVLYHEFKGEIEPKSPVRHRHHHYWERKELIPPPSVDRKKRTSAEIWYWIIELVLYIYSQMKSFVIKNLSKTLVNHKLHAQHTVSLIWSLIPLQ